MTTSSDGGEIIVIGTRPGLPDGGGGTGGTSGLGDPTDPAASIEPSEDDPVNPCLCAFLTDEQKLDRNVDAEVAEVLEEILVQANQDMEYGSLIWIDSNGVMQHTPLTSSPDEKARIDTSVLPSLPDGRTDFSGVVAMVHSHPEYIAYNNTTYYSEAFPDRLLYPWEGDWASYDSYVNLITSTGGDASAFKQYIIGFDGEGLVINEYDEADRGTNTSADGEPVDPSSEACTC